jgi:YgiT-type zinc finger domain-containing protein
MTARDKKGEKVPHHCSQCGRDATKKRGNYWFRESGLNNVLLKDIELFQCEYCRCEDPVIPRMNELMRVIAMALAEKPYALVGEEVRFLRKYLGMSQDTFSSVLGCDKTVLSKWERNQQAIGAKSDRLIRAVTVSLGIGLKPIAEQSVRKFSRIDREARSVPIELNTEDLTYTYA